MATGNVQISTVSEYLGQLFQASRRPNNFLKMAGGFNGVATTTGKEYPTGLFYDLRTPAQPAILEGADAPAAQYRAVTQATNVVQIFHEAINTTYLAQSDNTISGVVALPQGGMHRPVVNPRDPAWQVMAALETIAQDANYSFLRGTYSNPANPASTAMKTRGLITAVSTNAIDNSGDTVTTAAHYRSQINEAMAALVTSSGFNPDETWTWFGDATQYANIQAAFEGMTGSQMPPSREVAGWSIRTIYTRLGVLNIVLEPDMPADKFLIANMGVVGVVGLPVPGKGILFEEAVAKTGSTDKTQLYGQLGIDHGPEWAHAVVTLPSSVSLA